MIIAFLQIFTPTNTSATQITKAPSLTNMNDRDMTDLADQVNDIQVPLTAQSKAQRKRDDEVNSLLGTDMAGLAEEFLDIATVSHPSPSSELHDHQDLDSSSAPLSPLAIDQWISEPEDDARTPEEDNASLERALRELEEKRAKSRPKAPKKRNYGRVGRSDRVTKLAIRGGPPGKVQDSSKLHTEKRNYGRLGSNGGIIKRNMMIRGGRPGKVRSETKVGSSGTTEPDMVIRGGRSEKPRDDGNVHADRRTRQAPKEAYRKRMPPVEPVANSIWENLELEAWLQRGGRSWSTEAVADFGRDERDMYACFR
ncbi:hypothetical protein J4E93_009962 [Alternaria ventricosa]|uniref:uncharacterized protein n=1 Tax=Alternaria ventricosa TaxID=1187951 RepID=UPI0020C293A9|nr:uncharacterized protein J4E93_009962 [Alternaria ventricosa]KAI4638661.1 hypothetical protein J4E93_009962 [Alternaria ventricosa]